MGYLSNSTSFRLGISVRWKQPNYAPKELYFKVWSRARQVEEYLTYFFERRFFTTLSFIVSHVKVYNEWRTCKVAIYIYQGIIEEYIVGKAATQARRERGSAIRRYIANKQNASALKSSNKYKNSTEKKRYILSRAEKRKKFPILKGYVPKFVKKIQRNMYYSFHRSFSKVLKLIEKDLEMIMEKPVQLLFRSVYARGITSAIIGKYIRVRLKQFDAFNEVVFPMARYLSNITKYTGFQIRVAGRPTRQQRASFHKYQTGATPFNTYSYPLDHFFCVAVLKYGATSINVWLSRGFSKKRKPFYLVDSNNKLFI